MKIPYGYYINENNEVNIDIDKAEAVKLIYDMYIDNISLRKISEELSKRGFMSPSGNAKWSAQAIDNIISNKKYIGIVSFERFVDACFAKEQRKS